MGLVVPVVSALEIAVVRLGIDGCTLPQPLRLLTRDLDMERIDNGGERPILKANTSP